MTIKTRNRLNIAICILATVIFAFNLSFFLIRLFSGKLDFSFFYTLSKNPKTFFLIRYDPYAVIAALFIQNAYVIVSSFVLYRSFEKTQTTEIVYFSLFLLACIADDFRFLVPFFNLQTTYSKLLITTGNAVLFSRIMFPLSLLFTVLMDDTDFRQDIEKNSFILMLVSLFFAGFIPLKTAIINPNFSIAFGFKKTIHVTTIIILLAAIFTLAVKNTQRRYTQLTTIGFSLICIGSVLTFYATNYLFVILAAICYGLGSNLYFLELHKQYLWND